MLRRSQVLTKEDKRTLRLLKVKCMMPYGPITAHVYRNRVFVVRDNRPRYSMLFVRWTVKDKEGVETVRSFACDLTNMELAS